MRHPDQKEFDIFAADYDKRFIETYQPAYRLFQKELFRNLRKFNAPLRVLDIGCGNGWVAEQMAKKGSGTYLGIDPSKISLKILTERMGLHKSWRVFTVCRPAEWICKEEAHADVRKKIGGNPQLILCNAAFHQIRKTFPDIQPLLLSFYNLLDPNGTALFGDYYYSCNLDKSEIQKSLQWIKNRTGQNPTLPEGWFQPADILSMLGKTGYKIEETFETQANPEICLRYFLIKCAKEALK